MGSRITLQREQINLKQKLKEYDDFKWTLNELKYIGGLDISFHKEENNKGYAYFAVIEYPSLNKIYEDYEYIEVSVPYAPGFLAFREYPWCLKLIERMKNKSNQYFPQILLFDGNGILHPNGFGLASHVGVLLDMPTIGCSKKVFAIDGINKQTIKVLCDKNLQKGGDFVKIIGNSGKNWGAVINFEICCNNYQCLLSTSKNKDPIIISIGNKISIETAIKIVQNCCKFRVPEPIRIADLASRQLLKAQFEIDKQKYLQNNTS